MRPVTLSVFLLLPLAVSAGADDVRIEVSFPADGIERVVLRAAGASNAQVIPGRLGIVKVTGSAAGDAAGYHSPDPNWKETPASQWGMTFQSKRFGTTLVVSSVNEIGYIHHQYAIRDLEVELPVTVQLVREPRQLSGSGTADLHSP